MQLLGRLILLGGLVAALSSVAADAPRDPGSAGPFTTGAYSVTVTVPGAEALLPIEIHYPRSGDGVDPSASPYPGIVFAHGFMGSASTYPGNGQHLASWGYIVAMPDFTDEAIEVRTTEARHALTVLEAENARSASLLYQQVDTTRLGITGHSLGGCTTMMVSARDGRIKAAVALDPVNPEEFIGDGPWDHEAEAPNIWAPMAIIGAPSQMCNSNANYEGLYPHMGSRHKTKLVIADSSHCDYMVTDAALERWACYLLCGGEYDEGRVSLIQRYSTAWLNYYLKGDLAYYHYVYGVGFAQPESEGAYTSTLDTSPRNLRAIGDATGARLDWEVCDYAIVAGYNVYRWPQGQPCPASPVAQIGRVGDYHDTGATHGVLYHYKVASRDAAGQEHPSSTQVSVIPGALPTTTPTATYTLSPTSTPTPTPSVTPSPTHTSPPSRTPFPSVTPTLTPGSVPTATLTALPASRIYLPLLTGGR